MDEAQKALIERVRGKQLRHWQLSEAIDAGTSGVVFRGEPLSAEYDSVAIKLYLRSIVEGPDANNVKERMRRHVPPQSEME
jgi:hypothetical protein